MFSITCAEYSISALEELLFKVASIYKADEIRNMIAVAGWFHNFYANFVFVVNPLNSFVLFDNITQRELTTMNNNGKNAHI